MNVGDVEVVRRHLDEDRKYPSMGMVWGALALATVVFCLGFALATITIASGPSESGGGNNAARGTITFWSQSSVDPSVIPATVGGSASTVVNPATVLTAANQNYTINAATAGDPAVQWNFTEALGATLNTELQLVFVIVHGTVPVTSVVTIYLQTQAAAPTGPYTITLYFDAGVGALALQSELEVTNQCTALHSCP